MDHEFQNPPATIDTMSRRVTRIVTVHARRDVVWACLTDPEHIVHWLGDIAAFTDGVQAGAMGRFAWTGEVVLAARILHASDDVFSFEWSEGILSPAATTVTFTLKPAEGGTLVHFEEAGFQIDGDEQTVRGSLRALAQGWTVELDELVAYAESVGALA